MSILDWIFQLWWLDWVIVAVACGVAMACVPKGASADILSNLSLSERRESYSDLVTIAALLAGFSSVAFTTYLGWSSKKIERIRVAIGKETNKTWIALTVTPWVAALAIWFTRILDRGDPAPDNQVRWVALAAVVILILSVARSVWLFAELLDSHQHGDEKSTQETAAHMPKLRADRGSVSKP